MLNPICQLFRCVDVEDEGEERAKKEGKEWESAAFGRT